MNRVFEPTGNRLSYMPRSEMMAVIDTVLAALGSDIKRKMQLKLKGDGAGDALITLSCPHKPPVIVTFTSHAGGDAGFVGFSRGMNAPRVVMPSAEDAVSKLVSDVLDLCPEGRHNIANLTLTPDSKCHRFAEIIRETAEGHHSIMGSKVFALPVGYRAPGVGG